MSCLKTVHCFKFKKKSYLIIVYKCHNPASHTAEELCLCGDLTRTPMEQEVEEAGISFKCKNKYIKNRKQKTQTTKQEKVHGFKFRTGPIR